MFINMYEYVYTHVSKMRVRKLIKVNEIHSKVNTNLGT